MASTTGHGYLTIAVAVALLAVLQGLPPIWRAMLRYDRDAVFDGELWRLLTGHLIHLGGAHWALNAAGLVLCAVLSDRPATLIRPGWLLGRFAVLGLGGSLMLLALEPDLSHYAGLSGVLYGLFVLVLWPQVQRKEPIGIAALCTVVGWMLWQMVIGPSQSEMDLIGGRIVAQAHLYGVVSAVGVLLAQALLRAVRGVPSPPTGDTRTWDRRDSR